MGSGFIIVGLGLSGFVLGFRGYGVKGYGFSVYNLWFRVQRIRLRV